VTALEPETPVNSDDPALSGDASAILERLPHPPIRRRLARELFGTGLLILAVYALMNLLTARFIVDGSSMQPNFETGQYVLVDRLNYLLTAPARGDVVILISPEAPHDDLIKRGIGLPGETVTIENQQVLVDGEPLDEPYIRAAPLYTGTWTLGPEEYFVLGDNRNNSHDSHTFGPIERESLVGKATLIYWPPEDWGAGAQASSYEPLAVPAAGLPWPGETLTGLAWRSP